MRYFKSHPLFPARILLALIALVCIALGLISGEPELIVQKAAKICLECMGIG